jgi:uncharacterized membrane protein
MKKAFLSQKEEVLISLGLLAIGIYPLIIGSVADLNLLVLLPFATGMLFSLITMPTLIEKLLSKFDKNIYMIFAGFILGAGSSII